NVSDEAVVASHRETALRTRAFSQKRIEGIIRCNTGGILVFQTPFDQGWRAFVDNARAATLKADIGLLGVRLTEGEHAVEIRYLPPFFWIGGAVTIFSFLILGISF